MSFYPDIALVTGGIGLKAQSLDVSPLALDVAAGAKSSVLMALLDEDGPSGTFTHMGQPLSG